MSHEPYFLQDIILHLFCVCYKPNILKTIIHDFTTRENKVNIIIEEVINNIIFKTCHKKYIGKISRNLNKRLYDHNSFYSSILLKNRIE